MSQEFDMHVKRSASLSNSAELRGSTSVAPRLKIRKPKTPQEGITIALAIVLAVLILKIFIKSDLKNRKRFKGKGYKVKGKKNKFRKTTYYW